MRHPLAPSIHRLDREQWEMVMEGLRNSEPLPTPGSSREADLLYSQRHAKWAVAMESVRALCPYPRP